MGAESFYLHRISPFIIRFGENFGIRWYGVAYMAGFLVGRALLQHLSKTGRLKISLKDIDALMTYLILGVLVGGRLGYILFYEPSLLVEFDRAFPFWGLLAVNKGGMSSHGGFIGVWIMTYVFARKYHYPFLHVGDAIVIACPPALFLGRIANFINGELFGRPAKVPWAVCFPTEIMTWPEAAIRNLFDLVSKKGYSFRDVPDLLNAIPGNNTLAELVHPLLTPRHPSQIYEALLEGLALFVILWWGGKRLKRDGETAALFFWCYALMRIFAEQFREPDIGIGFQLFGMTRGQWLSLGMLVLGGIILYLSRGQKAYAPVSSQAKGTKPPGSKPPRKK